VGWFHGAESDTRSEEEILKNRKYALRSTGGTPETVHLDMIRLAFSSEAKLAIAPMQDYLGLGSEARLNIPGTTSDNWRWRVSDDQLSPELCESTAQLVEEMSRT
jgi:4-alpha-glucanotransferase